MSLKEIQQVINPLDTGDFGCQTFSHRYEYRRDLIILTYGNICNKQGEVEGEQAFDVDIVSMEYLSLIHI